MNNESEVVDIIALENRAKGLQEWLKKTAPEVFAAQKHLDEGSQERAYWHYGYLVAVRDVYQMLMGQCIPTQVHSSGADKNAKSLSA